MNVTKARVLKLFLPNILFILLTTAAWADISGTIFRDFNLNGTQDPLEPGISALTVTAYDDNGVVGLSQTTDANGNYTLTTGAGKYRVEVSNLPTYLKAGTAINGSTSALVSVVDNGDTHNVGLQNSGQYCQANPDIIMTRFTKDASNNGVNRHVSTILQFPYTANGTDAPTNISEYLDVGSVYGVAHLRKANVTYTSTYFKRHADIGPSGIGAIYKIDHANSNAVSTFATLPGTDPRNAGAGYDWNHDTVAYKNVGKRGIGDIDISDDESKLFAVNLEDRKLYVIDVDKDGNAGAQSSYAIPNPCTNAIDFRPMGLGFHDGMLYVGVTCTAESTVDANNADDSTNGPRKGDKTKLSAHIYSFTPATATFSAAPVLDIDLTYDRGCIYSSDISNTDPSTCTYTDKDGINQPYRANWNPWQMDYDIAFNDKKPGDIGNQDNWIEYMQPLLSDIEFDNDGSMIIAIRDINGDRTGNKNHSPNPADNDTHNGNGEGDILRACGNPQVGWTLESNGQCGGVTTGGANKHEGPGGGEYYWYDNGPGGNGHSKIGYTGTGGHSDTAMGGLLHVPGYNEIVTGAMDVHDYLDNGLLWLENDTGKIAKDVNDAPKRLLVSSTNSSQFFGKASGMGDLEALCDAPPMEIGNYVWDDSDGDGIQDPGENPLPNIKVYLYEGNTLVGTATTDANGEYYFGGASNQNMVGGNTLKPLTDYQLRIDLADPNLGGEKPTHANVNGNANDMRDSDGDNGGIHAGFSTIIYTTETIGTNDHTLDFGFVQPSSLGDTVWYDTNRDGIQDAGESGVQSVTVNLLDSNGNTVATTVTDANGHYSFTGLNPGDYQVQFDLSTLPANYVVSAQDQGGDDSKDSDANPTTGTTTTITLDSGENDPTWDMGINQPTASLGDTVWYDTNRDGIQDAGESGVQSVTVNLLDSNGNTVATTVTDANGHYSFTGLNPGDYQVQFDLSTLPANYVVSAQDQGGDDSKDSDANPTTGTTTTITLDSGENDPTWDMGIYPQLGSWNGHVLVDTDDNGIGDTPLPGVTIKLFTDPNGDGNPSDGTLVGTTTTDSNGNYSFINLTPGDYVAVEIQPSDYSDVSENEGGNDGDKGNNGIINAVAGTVTPGETDIKNDFVEIVTLQHNNCGCIPPAPVIPCAICTQESHTAHTHNLKDHSVELHWIDSYYEIKYNIYLNGKFVATVPEDTTRYTLTGLQSGTEYAVVIVANNGYGGKAKQTIQFKTTDSLGWLPAIYHILN